MNMENIESKVETKRMRKIEGLVHALKAKKQGILTQTDTYIRIPHGRLKFREVPKRKNIEVVYYQRPDSGHSRISSYEIISLDRSNGRKLKQLLLDVFGLLVIVRKRRNLYLFGNTRIHLDVVKKLGAFVELETVIHRQSKKDAEKEHKFLFSKLGLDQDRWESHSYSDLILRNNQ